MLRLLSATGYILVLSVLMPFALAANLYLKQCFRLLLFGFFLFFAGLEHYV